MKPKMAFLIDENDDWTHEPRWVWYAENDVPMWKIEHMDSSKLKRIVYWEIEE